MSQTDLKAASTVGSGGQHLGGSTTDEARSYERREVLSNERAVGNSVEQLTEQLLLD